MSLQPITILGFDRGLNKAQKPFLNPDDAFETLQNAYTWRKRVTQRQGLQLLGRLKRILTSQSLGVTTPFAGTTTINFADIFTTLGITGENAEIEPGSLVITIGAPDTSSFTDLGNGNFSVTGIGLAAGSFINYTTGNVVLKFSAPLVGGSAITANLNYFPSLPVMGIWQREIAAINDEQTIWFDTKYAYIWNGSGFQEFIPGTTWASTNSDFFWATNYRGVDAAERLFFETNFIANASNPMRYTDGVTWTDFTPALSGNGAQNISVGSIAGNGTTFSGNLSNPPIIPGSVTITVEGITFDDPTGSGTLTGNPVTNTGTIDYTNGSFTLNFNPTIKFTGPITNILTPSANAVVTSAGHSLTTGAEITISGVKGTVASEVNNKKFTITVLTPNTFQLNVVTVGNYTSGGDWTLTNQSTTVMASFQNTGTFLFTARILIPYYGRLLALNTWEGNIVASSKNFFNRCRFSQVGSPVQSDAWRADIFGKGGFLDAPTNEAIVGAKFIKNTLIVFFEQTTWQLRYVGEYGLPFLWERIAADFGSESTFSPVLFDQGVLAIGDKAIIAGDASGVDRIDLDIPDQIFDFKNANNGVKRVWGIRDYQRELVFWNYADAQTETSPGVPITFPNKVLLYNYRNNSYAIFRDSVTAFGIFQNTDNITWDSQTVTWDDESITWDDVDSQSLFPSIISGNQEGFIHLYGYITPDNESLSVTGFSVTGSTINLKIINHNLQPFETIYLTGMQFISSSTFLPITTDINNNLYSVMVVDADNIELLKWNFVTKSYENNFSFTPNAATSLYVGGGAVALFPKYNVTTKDFNLFQAKGLQTKVSYLDFLLDPTAVAMSVVININASTAVQGNMLIGNKEVTIALQSPFYVPGSDYAWKRFYTTCVGQYFSITLTLDDDLMNTLSTHQGLMTLNAINAWCRPGGKIVF